MASVPESEYRQRVARAREFVHMRMGVYQPGDDALSSKVDTPCLAPGERQNLTHPPRPP